MGIEVLDRMVFLVTPLAFICEFVDSSFGMGYGTSLTPVLLLLGFEPLDVVPAVLFSEFVSGSVAAFFHHSMHNVDFSPYSRDTKVAAVLSAFAVVGTIAAVLLAVRLPAAILKVWIGIIVILMGILILVTYDRRPRFHWGKITLFGTIASFNKGMSGGGYGPLVMGGQLLSGIGVKNAVGITSLSEAVVCLVGIILYAFLKPQINWSLAVWLMAGALLSVPLATRLLRVIPEKKGKIVMATMIIVLGMLNLAKLIGSA